MSWRRSLSVPVIIFALAMALTSIGLIGVYSSSAALSGHEKRQVLKKAGLLSEEASYHGMGYLKKQAISAFIGFCLMMFFYNFDYSRLKKLSFPIMAGCFILCGLVWMPGLGYTANGSTRWIRMGIGLMQPSEFAKLGLIIYMAKMLDDRRRYIVGGTFVKSFFSGVLPAMIVTCAFACIIVLEPDFGQAFVLCCVIFGMWVCGEMKIFHLAGLIAFGIPPAVMAFLLEPYRMKRMFAFWFQDDPEIRMREGFQLYQSLIAVGSGGPWGLGLGHSMQKYQYLFAGHTDFIFAILAEELGFAGCLVIMLLYLMLVIMGWKVALNTPDLFGSLLATGITLMVFLGASINMCVVLGWLPTKGLVLPFMSYGGSSLMVIMASMGILMNIAKLQTTLLASPVRKGIPMLNPRRI